MVDTVASPEQVRRALTDFSDRRLQTWSRTLEAKSYEVREEGETWAVARESTAGSPFWVVSRYDWSDPEVVRWTVLESSYGGGGDGEARISPGTGGGSHLQVAWENTDVRTLQRPLIFLLHHGPAARLFARLWAAALDDYARSGGG